MSKIHKDKKNQQSRTMTIDECDGTFKPHMKGGGGWKKEMLEMK